MTVTLTLLQAGYCTCPEHLARGRGPWRNIRFPALFALVQHPGFGNVLFDTGYSTEFFRATRPLPYRLYRHLTPVTLREEEAAVHQLAARGLRPGDVDHVLISHFHADHVSALKDFPQARYLYFPEAYEHVRGRRGWRALSAAYLPDVMPGDFDARAQPLLQVKPLPPAYAPFTEGADLFGDETLWAVRLPGHAHGQLGLLARTAAQEYFLVADACWHSGAVRDNHLPHPLANLIFANPAAYKFTLGQLHQFHQWAPKVIVIPSHCDEAAARYVDRLPAGAPARD
jgi:glyoxylase-like metal-dependent hydrolase (beta-lactamase superfamily II)